MSPSDHLPEFSVSGICERDIDLLLVEEFVACGEFACWFSERVGVPKLGHQTVMRAELSGRVEKALADMAEVDRQIIGLRHLEELTNDEVAEALGIKKAAASNRYVRALGRLRAILKVEPDDVH